MPTLWSNVMCHAHTLKRRRRDSACPDACRLCEGLGDHETVNAGTSVYCNYPPTKCKALLGVNTNYMFISQRKNVALIKFPK